jgi:hypothetical protein
MIIKKKDRSYTAHKKYIQGKGFLDTLSSTLRNVGSYMVQNKDLIAKPMLGAVGNLAAFGLTEVGKQQLTRLLNKNNKAKTTELSPKDLQIIQNILPNNLPTTNVIGSGIKKF